MTESDPRDTSPADFTELSWTVLVPRYVAPRVDGDTETRPPAVLPRRAIEQPMSGAAMAERVPARRVLEVAVSVETGARPGRSAGAADATAG